jgi:argininosuccinate lyase
LVVLDMKLYCLYEINEIVELIKLLQQAIVGLARDSQDVIIPAYTHLQSAQVVLFSHHLLAYVEMLERDKTRLEDTFIRTDVNPLGSCALSGTSLPIDRSMVSKELGFAETSDNSMDSVSDRDFIVELLSDLAMMGMHTSRLAEDLILWTTKEFNLVEIDWAYCTGSSIMPHKKNPDICELIRGETATLYANLNKVLVLMKGLPLTYNRDMQLDKTALFESVDKAKDILLLLAKIYETLKVKGGHPATIENEAFFSVDVMEYLIKKGVSYREAHDIVGKMVKECLDQGEKISALSLAQLKKYSPKFDSDVKILFNPKVSVRIKQSSGSTNPVLVSQQIKSWKNKLR